jgi:pyruvate,water dikinase
VLVPGQSCSGWLTTAEDESLQDGILLIGDLDLKDYAAVVRAKGVVCGGCESTSHIAVVCRILGVPVVVLDKAMDLLQPGDRIVVDATGGRVRRISADETGLEVDAGVQLARPNLPTGRFRYQLSIIEDAELIESANALGRRNIDHFFLREELLWVARHQDPFSFLAEQGPEEMVRLLVDALLPLVQVLEPDQKLNFRALDIRSDQRRHFGMTSAFEANPNLGLHGIRQLLLVEEYVAVELRAVDRLYEMGFENIIYSIPFLALEEELAAVIALREQICGRAIDVGVFVETPAAVAELPRLLVHGIAAVYVGTKDLAQLILGADRDNTAVAHLLNPNSPPVLEAIARVLSLCEGAGVPGFVFAFIENLVFLGEVMPNLARVSLPASDYLLGFGT